MLDYIRIGMKTFSYLSYAKLKNFIILRLSFFLSKKRERLHSNTLPCFISVEPANYCQLHCPECPVGKLGVAKSKHAAFNFCLFKNLIDELRGKLFHVIFYFQGEPLLHKQIIELISYAHKAKIYTSTSTNAQLLTDDFSEEIVRSGLDKLIISIDGTTQDTYETYRVGGSLQKTIKGIEHIVKWKKQLKSLTPLVELQFLVLRTNEHQMNDMKHLSKQLGADRLVFKTAQLYDFENGHELLTSHKKYARYKLGSDGRYHLKGKQLNRCWRLWSGAVVNVNGDVLPCCFDKDSSFVFGNINNESFFQAWHSKQAAAFRKDILNNRKQIDICRNCTG